MTGGETGGRQMDEPRGGGFGGSQGVWQSFQPGVEYDTETTGHMPLPSLTGARPRTGEDPLAAPGRVVPPEVPEGPGEEPAAGPEPPPVPAEPDPGAHLEHPLASYVLRVNGTDRPVNDVWLGESLLYVLRERLGLAGAKDGCEEGECGACSVQVDGRLVAACLVPAAIAAGCEVRTVEGLPSDGEPSDVQRALAASGAVQCGYCTPGLAMAIHDLLEGNHRPTEPQIRRALSGNLCRCTGYRGVLTAVGEVIASRDAVAEDTAAPENGSAYIPQQAGPTGNGGGR